MDHQKAGGKNFHRLFAFKFRLPWLLGSAAVMILLTAKGYLFRMWWFDEVLTLTNFAALPDPLTIYRSYVIPNNQIIHTLGIHLLWRHLALPPEYLRFFPLTCAFLLLFLLWNNWKKYICRTTLFLVLFSWMMSPPFMLYATALRGYMLAALLTVSALICGRKYVLTGKITALSCWFIFSYLTVGVMPSASAGLAAAGLYILPLLGRKFYRKKRFYLLAVMPIAAFLIFYLPIWDDLAGAFALKEGWHSHTAALLAILCGLIGSFNILPLLAMWQSRKSPWSFRRKIHILIWLLPLGSLILPVAPFPRVWWVIFPVWAILLAERCQKSVCLQKYGFIPVILAMAMGLGGVSRQISPWCSRAGMDDFFAPYYLHRDFTPQQLLPLLDKLPHPAIYVPLEADPWAIMAAVGRNVLFDGPRGRIAALPDGTAVILRKENPPGMITSRFGGSMKKSGSAGAFELYLWSSK